MKTLQDEKLYGVYSEEEDEFGSDVDSDEEDDEEEDSDDDSEFFEEEVL